LEEIIIFVQRFINRMYTNSIWLNGNQWLWYYMILHDFKKENLTALIKLGIRQSLPSFSLRALEMRVIRIPNPRKQNWEFPGRTITSLQSFDSSLMRIFIPRKRILDRAEIYAARERFPAMIPRRGGGGSLQRERFSPYLYPDYENNLRPPAIPFTRRVVTNEHRRRGVEIISTWCLTSLHC